jgi:agmatinase
MPTPTLTPVPQTFCGVPACADLSALSADFAVFGAGHGTPYKPGTPSHAANGPGAVRRALGWWSAKPGQWDFDTDGPVMGDARVVDCGDVPGSLDDGAANRAGIRAATEAILAAGAVPILLGGDDSTPIPFYEAFAGHAESLTVLQVDAHIDWRQEVEGVTHGYSSTMRRASEMDHVSGLLQLGARGPGSARAEDLEAARAWGAQLYPARRLHAEGLAPALAAIPEGGDLILSIDVDGIDPAVMPGVVLPAFGGLTWQQMLDVLTAAATRARVRGIAFVEYVPEADPSGLGAKAIARLACCAAALVQRAAGQRAVA